MTILRRLFRSSEGQDLIEYLLIGSLVAVVAYGGVNALGGAATGFFAAVRGNIESSDGALVLPAGGPGTGDPAGGSTGGDTGGSTGDTGGSTGGDTSGRGGGNGGGSGGNGGGGGGQGRGNGGK